MVLLAGFMAGCSTNTEEFDEAALGKAYYPLAIGDYRVYNVTDIRWLQNKREDSSVFQVRERVDTLFSNLAGEPTYKIIRSWRPTSLDPWVDDSVIMVTVSKNQVRRRFNNQDLVKLIFPVSENKSWSPNVYNNIDFDTINGNVVAKPLRSRYTAVGQPFTVNGKTFDKTVTVMVNDFVSFINKDVRTEVYAENIGMIYKKYEILDYCTQAPCNAGPDDFILTGYERIEELEAYGKIE